MNELYGASEQEVLQAPMGEGLWSLPWVPGKEKPFLDGTLTPQSFLLPVPFIVSLSLIICQPQM